MSNSFYNNLNFKTKNKLNNQMNNNMMVDGKLYCSKTGEYIGDKFNVSYSLKLSETQLENFKSNNEMYEFEKSNGGFIFVFYRLLMNMDTQLPNLTKPEIARLLYLITYVQFNTNRLVHNNGKNINDEFLINKLKLKPKQYKTFIRKLIKNNYMSIDIDGYKVLSPYLCKRGEIDTKQLKKHEISYTRIFKDTIRSIFENATVTELNKISVIYMILPYLSLKYNIVCHNPLEEDVTKINPMSITLLCEKLGFKDSTALRNQLYKIRINNQYVFSFWSDVTDKRKLKVILNPDVVFGGGEIEHLKAVQAYFNEVDQYMKG